MTDSTKATNLKTESTTQTPEPSRAAASTSRDAVLRKSLRSMSYAEGADALAPRSGGDPLPAPVASRAAATFGTDMSDVRVHTGPQANAVQAKAYAQGSDVHFAPGQYDTSSSGGMSLLGHELAHVVQQKSGRVGSPQASGSPVVQRSDLEAEADRAGEQFAAGRPAGMSSAGPAAASAAVQRKEGDGQTDIDKVPNIDGSTLPGAVILPNEVEKQFYAHGGFMGAAPELLKDPMWNKILKVLMIDVYQEVYSALEAMAGRAGSAPSAVTKFGSIIPMFENNPVMSAYGMWKTKELDRQAAESGKAGARTDRLDKIEAFEWDAFLPTGVVKKYKSAEDKDKDALAEKVVKEMIIAHGTKAQTVFEAKIKHQHHSVQDTKKTNYGGVMPLDWMDLFGKALKLAGSGDQFDTVYGQYKDAERHRDPKKSADQTFVGKMSPEDVIKEYRKLFGKDRQFSVIIDVKSRDATVDILKAMTRVLNGWGVHVGGFGSFVFDEIEGVESQEQMIDGKKMDGPKAVKFVHLVGSVLTKVKSGEIKIGDHVMFNAGSLVKFDKSKKGQELKDSYAIDQGVVDELKTLKHGYELNLGLYTQEPDIDPKAVELLTDLANAEKATFNMGFAWGGLANSASGEVETGDTAKVGFGGQDSWFVAEYWKTDQLPVQKSIVALWARSSSPPLQQVIESQTDIKFPKAVSDDQLVASWPVVVSDYSYYRDVSCQSITLDWKPTGDEADQKKKAPAAVVLKMKMLGSSGWTVKDNIEVTLKELYGPAKKK